MKSQSVEKVYTIISTVIIWFALGLQFKLSLALKSGDVLSTLAIFLSYFTVLTNILCALCLSSILLFKNQLLGKFFTKPSTLTAITIYIMVVGIIYNFALRGLIEIHGWDAVANELLHVVNPLLFLGFWLFFVDKSTLNYKQAFPWLIYPLCYVFMTVIRGAIIQEYPYPFINVVKLGYPKAILNTAIIMLVFWLLSLIFIFIGKRLDHRN
ncbi:Pr6Pr family membrane protein [Pedobacter aquatilis]|uniref:Pr6Pr family membrane protein n=1 Tax=Pedobacter aquatilis TaxID=351343 RepID=UPI0025B5ED18|nr:Pr6Pr family membrane protein [Pedobacter aquatilis]MDN3587783.1 Pr6Pr family membrane protein [Pedobacter aquatilis]